MCIRFWLQAPYLIGHVLLPKPGTALAGCVSLSLMVSDVSDVLNRLQLLEALQWQWAYVVFQVSWRGLKPKSKLAICDVFAVLWLPFRFTKCARKPSQISLRGKGNWTLETFWDLSSTQLPQLPQLPLYLSGSRCNNAVTTSQYGDAWRWPVCLALQGLACPTLNTLP